MRLELFTKIHRNNNWKKITIMKALLALEDGRTFPCRSFTGHGEACGEIVFNTSMTGYQEVLTDPSYKNQLVTMTYPLIGNYGVNHEDIESNRIQVAAFLVKEYQHGYSNFRATSCLAEYLNQTGILGVESLDTRALTRHIRNSGAMRAFISTQDLDPLSCVKKANDIPEMMGQDLVKAVSTDTPYLWINGKPLYSGITQNNPNKDIWGKTSGTYRVAVFDFGVKYNILRCLESLGCSIVVLPATTCSKTVTRMEPDGIFLSNGPGDPEPVNYAIKTIKELLEFKPMFGICLGIQILGLALGGKTFKLKFGHRGANQPVKNLSNGKIEITSQNHGFALDIHSLKDDQVELTHVNLNDNTVEGFKHKTLPVQAVQYHPEASPGPHDANYFFKEFIHAMEQNKT
jgi:carbamoyl-phosphate synthase small subunit